MTWTQSIRTSAATARRESATRGVALWRVGVFVAGIALWAMIAAVGIVPAGLVPAPSAVVVALAQEVVTAGYWQALGLTLWGALAGLLAAAVVGIAIGVITGASAAAELSTRFLVDFGRAFPAIALIAVLVLILGRGIELKSVLVFVAVVFPIILQTQQGVRQVPSSVIETARSFRIPRALLVRRVMLPSATPSILTGLRLGASVGILVAIATEVLSGSPGIGNQITEAQMGANSALSFAYIVTAGLLGFAVNAGLEKLQTSLLKWRPAMGGDD
ncbi:MULTISPECIES: ABC transporter permease [unclassified Microbacterium]|uniref:ABC transporter permease n=1 Tax=unclassified Microbacterium TaxID=2609290 RepID=UPI00214CBFCD|nr:MULTISPECIES: ABC transporter permease [unclassified Microbacterium]MCR2810935.1 ABC transporter permease [Microbacterium sp. zg.B185]WIM19666.1 ABC transporter permease [Microbacterium sp. zg-B185]